ncbi:MAG: hypothetical protein PHP06_06930 [Clostridia bacterium]|nr:hypothetical protein [Clostridia bacterium]
MEDLSCSICGCPIEREMCDSCPECEGWVCDECTPLYDGYCEGCYNEFIDEYE